MAAVDPKDFFAASAKSPMPKKRGRSGATPVVVRRPHPLDARQAG
jgi:hypothetical protein